MKYIFIILFVFNSIFTFGQMTVIEMMNLYKMDASEFETYALKNKFTQNGKDEKKNLKGYEYAKYSEKLKNGDDRFISLLDIFFNKTKAIKYVTSNTNEYLNFKSQLKSFGYKLCKNDHFFETEFSNLRLFTFRNNDFEILIFLEPKKYMGSSESGYWRPNFYSIIIYRID